MPYLIVYEGITFVVSYQKIVGFEVFTPVIMKSSVLSITMYSLLKVNRYLRGTCCLYLQGQRISQTRNHPVTLKCQLAFNGLNGVISQKIELFMIYHSVFQGHMLTVKCSVLL
jgi:hypothetical protein